MRASTLVLIRQLRRVSTECEQHRAASARVLRRVHRLRTWSAASFCGVDPLEWDVLRTVIVFNW